MLKDCLKKFKNIEIDSFDGLLVDYAARRKAQAILRGAALGLAVSFAFYATSGFEDPISFVAGIVYGALIEVWLTRGKK